MDSITPNQQLVPVRRSLEKPNPLEAFHPVPRAVRVHAGPLVRHWAATSARDSKRARHELRARMSGLYAMRLLPEHTFERFCSEESSFASRTVRELVRYIVRGTWGRAPNLPHTHTSPHTVISGMMSGQILINLWSIWEKWGGSSKLLPKSAGSRFLPMPMSGGTTHFDVCLI